MVDPLQFGRLTDARRARPRRFRLFNAHLEEYSSENDVKSRLAVLLSDNLARNTAFWYALRSPWALTIPSKIPGRISGNFHGQMVPQAAQTLFVIYIRDSIALRFEPFTRMYENGSKIALNSTCSKGFK